MVAEETKEEEEEEDIPVALAEEITVMEAEEGDLSIPGQIKNIAGVNFGHGQVNICRGEGISSLYLELIFLIVNGQYNWSEI